MKLKQNDRITFKLWNGSTENGVVLGVEDGLVYYLKDGYEYTLPNYEGRFGTLDYHTTEIKHVTHVNGKPVEKPKPKFKEGDYVIANAGVCKRTGYVTRHPDYPNNPDGNGDFWWVVDGLGFKESEMTLAIEPCPFKVGDWVRCTTPEVVNDNCKDCYGKVTLIEKYVESYKEWVIVIDFGCIKQRAYTKTDGIVKA